MRDADGGLHDIQVNRLKDKLGTRKVPTAELTLDGAPRDRRSARPSDGVANITPMLNVTRTWNAVGAVVGDAPRARAREATTRGAAWRSARRSSSKPLHVDTLAALEAEYEGAFRLAFRVVELLGATRRAS